MKLFRSGENYLKTILILQKQKGAVRSLDVADHLHFSRASVCRAMRVLQEGGYLTMDRDKLLHLTPLGRKAAESVYERHSVLNDALLAMLFPQDHDILGTGAEESRPRFRLPEARFLRRRFDLPLSHRQVHPL